MPKTAPRRDGKFPSQTDGDSFRFRGRFSFSRGLLRLKRNAEKAFAIFCRMIYNKPIPVKTLFLS